MLFLALKKLQNHSPLDSHAPDKKFSHNKFSILILSEGFRKSCQMCKDHPFSQRNKSRKRAVMVEIDVGREGGLDKV